MLKQDYLIIESRLEKLISVQQWFQCVCTQASTDLPWIDDIFDQLNLALAEGFTNAVRHAHGHLPPETPIQINLEFSPDQLDLKIWDCGDPFDPSVLQEPQPGTLREGGYGWFLLRRLGDIVRYERSPDNRNCLHIIKYSKNQ